jgi:hypothetical protein
VVSRWAPVLWRPPPPRTNRGTRGRGHNSLFRPPVIRRYIGEFSCDAFRSSPLVGGLAAPKTSDPRSRADVTPLTVPARQGARGGSDVAISAYIPLAGVAIVLSDTPELRSWRRSARMFPRRPAQGGDQSQTKIGAVRKRPRVNLGNASARCSSASPRRKCALENLKTCSRSRVCRFLNR